MIPEPLEVETLMEEAEHREGIEQLLLPLVDQVLAVGIQHDPVALENVHHLQQMIGRVLEQGSVAEQTPDQFLLVRKRWSGDGQRCGGGHDSPPLS